MENRKQTQMGKSRLILAAEMAGLRIEDCLAAAYDEIKDRTGTMTGGVFVKDKP
jgi:hypothetical protein